MKKLALIVVALTLVAAACSSSGDIAATVNGEEISVADVEEFAGGSDTEITDRTRALETLIQWAITKQAAAEQFGFEPTDDDIQAEIDNIVATTGVESFAELAESENTPEDVLREYVVQLMVQDTLTTELEEQLPQPSDEEVAAELVENDRNWTVVCTLHLLVETEEDARAALDRIDSGEPFPDVASEVSIDTGSALQGGDLGCSPASRFVEEFAEAAMTAEIDVPVGPVESQFGFHVLVVSSREIATDDEVRASIVSERVRAAADEWFLAASRAADVEITDGFGTWITDPTPSVVPSLP